MTNITEETDLWPEDLFDCEHCGGSLVDERHQDNYNSETLLCWQELRRKLKAA